MKSEYKSRFSIWINEIIQSTGKLPTSQTTNPYQILIYSNDDVIFSVIKEKLEYYKTQNIEIDIHTCVKWFNNNDVNIRFNSF